jgi:hypothetical protein
MVSNLLTKVKAVGRRRHNERFGVSFHSCELRPSLPTAQGVLVEEREETHVGKDQREKEQ